MNNYDYFNTWGYVDGVGNYIALSSKNINEEEIQDIVDKSFNTTELKSEGQELQLSINGKNVSTVTIEDKYLQDVKFDEITKELIFTVDDGSDVLKIDLSEALSEFATKKDIEDKINNSNDPLFKIREKLEYENNEIPNSLRGSLSCVEFLGSSQNAIKYDMQ